MAGPYIPEQLQDMVEQVKRGERPKASVRTLLSCVSAGAKIDRVTP
jgi:hypothetical protein